MGRADPGFVSLVEQLAEGRELGHAWELVARAARLGWFQPEDLDDVLDNALDFTVEELRFEPFRASGRVTVALLDDEDEVDASELTAALEALRERARGRPRPVPRA